MKRMVVVMALAISMLFVAQTVWASSFTEEFEKEFEKFITESWKQINSSGVKVDSPECREANLGHDDAKPDFSASGAYRAALMCVAQYAGPLAEQGISQRALLRKMHGQLRNLKLQYDREVSVNSSLGIRVKYLEKELAGTEKQLAETGSALKVASNRRAVAEKTSAILELLLVVALLVAIALATLLALKFWKSAKAQRATNPDDDAGELTERVGRLEDNFGRINHEIAEIPDRVIEAVTPRLEFAAEGGAKARARALLAEQIAVKGAEGNTAMVEALTRAMEAIG